MRTTRDDEDIARDGEVLRVPMYLADGGNLLLHDGMGNRAGHKPGYVFASGGAAEGAPRRAYTDYKQRLGDAWRGDGEDTCPDAGDPRAAYIRQLTIAWRGAR